MKKDFIAPIIALSLICLFVSGALAVVNSKTYPVIIKAAEERAKAAMRDIVPEAVEFAEIGEIAELHRTITGIFRAVNNSGSVLGYVFMITTHGYGGEIKLICGINMEGRIIKTATLSQTETKGMATPVFGTEHQNQYTGKNKNLDDVNAVSGATISSNAYRTGISNAFHAYEIIMSHLNAEQADE